MAEYKIGIYIRLSQADVDLSKNDKKAESESISHQRTLINRYLDSKQEFKGCSREEFFDDGFSGTNFARPAFEKMMEKIRKGEINLVSVKDFSRFGRDYIELGDYLERIFPFMGVRFISVNDNYDSDDYKGTTGGMDIVLKNIVYDYYSKDLSDKVLTSKYAIMKRGHYQGGRCPFGYMKSDVKGKLIPDPDTAPVVKRIFELACEGKNTGEIRDVLVTEKIPTPSEFYLKKHPDTKLFKGKGSSKVWMTNKVLAIIQDESYYGAVVQHKRQSLSVGSRHTVAVPKEEQFIVEGMHEPIVSKEDWLKAQSVIRSISKRSKYVARDYPLKGVMYCGVCHRALEYHSRVKQKYFLCRTNYGIEGSECYQGKIFEEGVSTAVWESLQMYLQLAEELSGKLKKEKKKLTSESDKLRSEIESLQKQLRSLESDKYLNMDKYMAEDISKESFLKKKAKLEEQINAIDLKVKELSRQLEVMQASGDGDTEQMITEIKKYSKEKGLNNEMVRTFINRVLVTDNDHIEIEWKFTDAFIKFLEDI